MIGTTRDFRDASGALRFGPALFLTSSLALGCSDDIGAARLDPAEAAIEALVSKGAPTPREITIASTPHARCTISSHLTQETMPVWADDVGLLHLWAAETTTPETYRLECEEEGKAASRVLDLSDPELFQPATARARPTGRSTLPALTETQALSPEELIHAGYPPRPDPVRAAPLYKRWLDLVSKPMTLIRPNLVHQPGVEFGPVEFRTSSAWSGSILHQTGTRFVWAIGTMQVPHCQNPAGTTSSRVAFWAGLDGWATGGNVIQDGFMYENVGGVGRYVAWYEYFPLAPVFDSTMVVRPNDSVTFWAWEGDVNCTAGVGRVGYGCFWYKNNTTNVTAGTFTVERPNMFFTGTTGEAIAERVGWPVSKFSFGTNMEFAIIDYNGGWHSQATNPYYIVGIVNGAGQQLVAAADLGTSNTVLWTWLRAQ